MTLSTQKILPVENFVIRFARPGRSRWRSPFRLIARPASIRESERAHGTTRANGHPFDGPLFQAPHRPDGRNPSFCAQQHLPGFILSRCGIITLDALCNIHTVWVVALSRRRNERAALPVESRQSSEGSWREKRPAMLICRAMDRLRLAVPGARCFLIRHPILGSPATRSAAPGGVASGLPHGAARPRNIKFDRLRCGQQGAGFARASRRRMSLEGSLARGSK